MTSFNSIAGVLSGSLHLTQPPIAIAFAESLPEGIKTFTGSVPAGCRFWQEATTQVFATVAAHHELCAIGMHTHHLPGGAEVQKDLQDTLKVLGDLEYVRPEDMPFIPVLNHDPKVVIYGPLAEIPVAPDVVLLFVEAGQTLILSEASQQLENGLPPALGRPACGVVAQAYNTGRTALSLGCCGARAYLDILLPEVALYAIPGAKLEAFAERVAKLANANNVLTSFHTLRRRDVEAGKRPTVQETLAAM